MEEKRTLKKYFDKVYCINYIEGKERRENIKKMFSDYGLIDDIEFIYGMPFGKINAIKPYFEEIAKLTPRGVGSVNSMGCAFSHYTTIKTAYELGYNSILVIEDDVIIRNDLDLIFNYLDNIPKDWNYLYFTLVYQYTSLTEKNPKLINDLNLFKNSKEMWVNMNKLIIGQDYDIPNINETLMISSGAYAMDRKAMKLYIKLFESDNKIVNSDMLVYFYHNISQSPLNMYIPKQQLFITDNVIDSLKFDITSNSYIIHPWIVAYSTDAHRENFLSKYKLLKEKSFIWDNGKVE